MRVFGTILRFLLPIAVVGGGVAVLMTLGRPPVAAAVDLGEERPTLVEAEAVRPHDGPLEIVVDGEAVPYRLVTISAEVAGRVVAKPDGNRAGLFVPEGETLFEIDKTDHRLEVARLRAQLQQAEEQLKENAVSLENAEKMTEIARAELEVQRSALKRTNNLRRQNATSSTEADRATLEELTARRAAQTNENEVRSFTQRRYALAAARDLAAASLERAETDLARTTVTAPFGGTVVSDTTEVGDYVQRGDPLVQMSDSSRMDVKCELRIDDLVWVWQQARGREEFDPSRPSARLELPETPVEVVFEFRDSAIVWDGVLSRYEGAGLDTQTRTVPCRVHVDEPAEATLADDSGAIPIAAPPSLLSGMYVKVRIPVEPPTPLLRVPHRAVRPGGRVWVVRDGRLRVEPLSVVRDTSEYALAESAAEGASGLRAGDLVVTSPLPGVADGMAVRLSGDDAEPAGSTEEQEAAR